MGSRQPNDIKPTLRHFLEGETLILYAKGKIVFSRETKNGCE